MRKIVIAVCAVGLATACLTGAAFAQKNANVTAYLSWNGLSTVSDLTTPGAANNLFLRFDGVDEFKGAEVEITWDPVGNQADCFAQVGFFFKTSLGTTCTYLNRGSAVPVTLYDEPGRFAVAWANAEALTGCTSGTVFYLTMEFDGADCSEVPLTGCFRIKYAKILDAANVIALVTLASPTATVNGGGTHCDVLTPVEPTTWGNIKSIFKREN